MDETIDIVVLTGEKTEDAIAFAYQINSVEINRYFNRLNAENAKLIKQANLKIYP